MNFIKTSIKHKQVTLTILIMVFIAGVFSLLTMPRREDPKISVPSGLVVAYYPGASAAQVEEQVTAKLEEYLFQFEEVDKRKTVSTTQDGLVVIEVTVNNNVKEMSVFWNKLRHQMLMAKQLNMPEEVRGPIVNSDFGDTEALLLAIESPEATYEQLLSYSKLLENNIRTVEASSKIKRLGEQPEEISVYFDSQKLSQFELGIEQVVKVLQSQNAVGPTGELKTGGLNVSLYASGTFSTITDVENQIIGTSKSGSVIRLKDIATIKREYAEPSSGISVNGHKALIVTVQMQEGYNIVKFGDKVQQKIAETQKQLPANVKITTIVNQPEMVDSNISHFLKEFLMAIVAVIIVLMLLLPFNMAAIAATAIPMTIAVTFALLNVFNIELHQVSLAALIVVLGMIVDDAIVVADNYLALLERGEKRMKAAWRSASDLVIPIFGATITIIASFVPMVILKGALGEFIRDLPYTAAIAFTASFLVSMVFTPILCVLFVKKAKHTVTDETSDKKKKSLLDYMQEGYNNLLEWSVKHKYLVIGTSLSTIALAFLIFKMGVGQRFFPFAERNQFVVELWAPTGTSLKTTQEAIEKIENLVKEDQRVTSYAAFYGASAPRVYYNFSPEFPVTNYGQLLINTDSNESTEKMAVDLQQIVESAVPEGVVQVKLMQQGQPMKAPVEVRIYGDDVNKLKQLSNSVKAIINNERGSLFVDDDFKEDYFGLQIELKGDASRLGFTTESIAKVLYANVSGYPVSNMYEKDNSLAIVLRLEQDKRKTYQDLENIYLQSPITGASVPLRQVAQIKPDWQPGRVVHRNGMRCITVSSQTSGKVLPEDLRVAIAPQLEKIDLPLGYRIEFGGEYDNKNEAFGQIVAALFISLILVFLILLIQFKNLKELFIIMMSIPLSLFGAFSGLAITGYNFGFTALIGLISLLGIVVRNAIILIDQMKELQAEGYDIKSAAIESGKRRLRPIFLTTMSSSLGLLPMILSGSSLWGPLASTIAFGVFWSMIMALITVPVLYTMLVKPDDSFILENSPASEIVNE